jgi:protein-arginine kinase
MKNENNVKKPSHNEGFFITEHLTEDQLSKILNEVETYFRLLNKQNPHLNTAEQLMEKFLTSRKWGEYTKTIAGAYVHLVECEIHYTFPLNEHAKSAEYLNHR